MTRISGSNISAWQTALENREAARTASMLDVSDLPVVGLVIDDGKKLDTYQRQSPTERLRITVLELLGGGFTAGQERQQHRDAGSPADRGHGKPQPGNLS